MIVDRPGEVIEMDMNLHQAQDRVWSLHPHYVHVIENTGFGDLLNKKFHIAVAHIMKLARRNKLR